MIYSTEAIVLKNTPYAEADLIVTYFTKEFGVIDLFAKSPRKIKSKFGSSLEPLTHSRISFIGKEDRLQKIIQSDIINPFQQIRENLFLFLKTAEILKIILQILPKRQPHSELFRVLLDSLFFIQKAERIELFTVFLKLKILRELGYLPDFNSCGRCRNSLNAEIYYLDGFVLCYNCMIENPTTQVYKISKGTAKLLNKIPNWDINFISRVKIVKTLISEVDEFITKHINRGVKV